MGVRHTAVETAHLQSKAGNLIFMGRVLKRVAAIAGLTTLGLVAFYRWQPQRYQFRERPTPDDNPAIDPASEFLFSEDSSIVVVIAHPDDAEFYLGGTLARLKEYGARIALIVTTDGDKGYYPMVNAEKNRSLRKREQVESALLYGCEEVIFLGGRDGRLKKDSNLVRQIRDFIESFGAQYVFSFDPLYPPKVQHSDHLRTGEATAEAVKDLEDVEWLVQFSTSAANFAVDITDSWSEKRRLLAVHKSQFHGRKQRFIEDMLRNRAAQDGALAGVPLAEAFRVVRKQR
jgi:LmbE family N-acetylglucosaminyl deacetylase